MEKKKRYWADSSVRAKRWRAKQGKAVLTYLHPSVVKALHEEAKRKNKAVWKLLRSCVSYGLPSAAKKLVIRFVERYRRLLLLPAYLFENQLEQAH